MPSGSSADSPKRRPRRGGFWSLLAAVLVINWIVMSLVLGPPPRTTVSYTFFEDQLDAGNVEGRHHPG
jgi:cell division protease FtsH